MYHKNAPETIQAMFATIAHHYDRANTTFTFGLHKRWNRQLIHALGNPKRLLDLCAGTGEVAFGYLKKNRNSKAILLDFCPEMLAIAQQKGLSLQGRFELITADAQMIPLPDHSVDAVAISYGIRNIKDPEKCFREAHRVLACGGSFAILEATRPTSLLPKIGHRLHTRFLLPLLGKLVAKNIDAYKYLASSVDEFASPDTLEALLYKAGFQHVKRRPLTFGSATLFIITKE